MGEQIAYAAAKSAVVVVTGRRDHKLQEVQRRCQELSRGPSYAYTLDVADSEQIKEVLGRIRAELGPPHVLVNNAGFGLFVEAVDTDQQVTEEMFRVNVLGLIQVTQEVARDMQRAGRGISSTLPPKRARLPRRNLLSMQPPSSRCGDTPTHFAWNLKTRG